MRHGSIVTWKRMDHPPRPRAEVPGSSREAASYVAQGAAVLRKPWVCGRFLFLFPIQPGLTPRAEVTSSREHGGRRHPVPLCVSFDAAHHAGMTLGQGASERGLEEEKSKNARKPRVRGVPLTLGYIRRRSRGLVPALPREAGEDSPFFSM